MYKSEYLKTHLQFGCSTAAFGSEGKLDQNAILIVPVLLISFALAGGKIFNSNQKDCIKYYTDLTDDELDKLIDTVILEPDFNTNYPDYIAKAIEYGKCSSPIFFAQYCTSFATVNETLDDEKWKTIARLYKKLGKENISVDDGYLGWY